MVLEQKKNCFGNGMQQGLRIQGFQMCNVRIGSFCLSLLLGTSEKAISWSKVLVDLKSQCQLKDRSSAELLCQNPFCKLSKNSMTKKKSIFHLILNINIFDIFNVCEIDIQSMC